MIQHQQVQQHIGNVVALMVPVTSLLSHAPEFFTATSGLCVTVWYIIYFTREYRRWRRERRRDGLTKAPQDPPDAAH